MSFISNFVATGGAANDAASGGAGADISDIFSTYLYTGNSATQTITNGIDLAGEGGLVITGTRSSNSSAWVWTDTVQGTNTWMSSDRTDPVSTDTNSITAFNNKLDHYFDNNFIWLILFQTKATWIPFI